MSTRTPLELMFLLSENDGYMWREYKLEKSVPDAAGYTWRVSTTYHTGSVIADLRITSYDMVSFRGGCVVGAQLTQLPGRSVRIKLHSTGRFVQIKLHS